MPSAQQNDLSADASPWGLPAAAAVRITPPRQALRGQLEMPGSKSLTNRALLLAACAQGRSTLRGILRSDDAYWCVDALRRLGVVLQVDATTAVVHGCGRANGTPRLRWPRHTGSLQAGSAATVARFLPGLLLAGQTARRGAGWLLHGSAQLQQRPMRPLWQALQAWGAQLTVAPHTPSGLPLRLRGIGAASSSAPLRIDGAISSQFCSALLLAAPLWPQGLHLEVTNTLVQADYVAMTLQLMRAFGVETPHWHGQRGYIAAAAYHGCALQLGGDWSTAGYFCALTALLGGTLRLSNLAATPYQPDQEILTILRRMGVRIDQSDQQVEVCATGRLRGGMQLNLQRMGDQTPTLAVLACFATAPIGLRGVAHIRYHECDRIRALCHSLRCLGGRVQEHDDGLTVYPQPLHGASLATFGDHRLAMALALIGSRVTGVRLLQPHCVSKTCPNFFSMLQTLGLQVQFDAI